MHSVLNVHRRILDPSLAYRLEAVGHPLPPSELLGGQVVLILALDVQTDVVAVVREVAPPDVYAQVSGLEPAASA